MHINYYVVVCILATQSLAVSLPTTLLSTGNPLRKRTWSANEINNFDNVFRDTLDLRSDQSAEAQLLRMRTMNRLEDFFEAFQDKIIPAGPQYQQLYLQYQDGYSIIFDDWVGDKSTLVRSILKEEESLFLIKLFTTLGDSRKSLRPDFALRMFEHGLLWLALLYNGATPALRTEDLPIAKELYSRGINNFERGFAEKLEVAAKAGNLLTEAEVALLKQASISVSNIVPAMRAKAQSYYVSNS